MASVLASLHRLFVHVAGVALFPGQTKIIAIKVHLEKGEKTINPLVEINRV